MQSERTPPDVEERICELYQEGRSIKSIATEIGISKSTVGKIFKRRNIAPRPRGRAPNSKTWNVSLLKAWEQSDRNLRPHIAKEFGYVNERSARNVVNRIRRNQRTSA